MGERHRWRKTSEKDVKWEAEREILFGGSLQPSVGLSG